MATPPPRATRFDEALALHRRLPVVDGHADSILPVLAGQRSLAEHSAVGHFDFPRARVGGLTAIIQTVWPHSYRHPDPTWRIQTALERLVEQVRLAGPAARLATTAAEVRAAQAAGQVAVLVNVEAAESLGGQLAPLADFHRQGARVFQPVPHHPESPPLGAIEAAGGGGLTAFGRSLVAELNRLGMVIDVSHLMPRGLDDVLTHSARPVAFSHAGCRALVDHPHNLTDAQLRALAAQGGLVGIAVVDAFLGGQSTYRTVADHIDHAVQMIGPAHVGLGTDFDGTDRLAQGVEDVTLLPNITADLLARGYQAADLALILGGAWLRLFEQVLGR